MAELRGVAVAVLAGGSDADDADDDAADDGGGPCSAIKTAKGQK